MTRNTFDRGMPESALVADAFTEVNIDAMVGPTHHFGGLGVGNVASREHASQTSHPRRAALEGLRKAEFVASLGVPQFIWLPPQRPRFDLLERFGFSGPRRTQLQEAFQAAPRLLSAACSSAFMWAANSATVTPRCDATDDLYHFTPANLISSWHRAVESQERMTDLATVFGKTNAIVHQPLPSILPLRDEGAANHMRLCDESGRVGLNMFVHGEDEGASYSSDFLPRHTRAASEMIARVHKLDPQATFFLHQNPDAISSGVFHNDVIATSHKNMLIYHERAFVEAAEELHRLDAEYQKRTGQDLIRIEVAESELSLEDAVSSYFFNSQILTPNSQAPHGTGGMDRPRNVLVCPTNSEDVTSARTLIDRLVCDPCVPIDEVHFVSLAESMANGGGPACLRLRVPVDADLMGSMDTRFLVTKKLVDSLSDVVEVTYPETLNLKDLSDIECVECVLRAAAALHRAVGAAS